MNKRAKDMWNNKPIQQVIDQGLKLLQNNQVTDSTYQIWVEYSKSMLNIATKNPTIYSNYLSVIFAASNSSIQPSQRLSMCLQYLIKIQPII